MRGLDWPDGFERTREFDRKPNRRFQASLATTTSDLETELDRLDPDDWRASTGNQHTKSNGLPLHNAQPDDPGFVLRWTADDAQYAVACDAYSRLRDNVRAVSLWLHDTRMRSQRPVVTGEDDFAAARLPPGDDTNAVVAQPAQNAPQDVLGVAPDAPEGVVKAAARELKKQTHPDRPDGDEERFKEIVSAEEAMLDE